MKNILVTGGAGYIGTHTIVELVASGYNPVILDNFSNSDKSVLIGVREITGQDVKLYDGDYRNVKLLEKIIDDEKIDGVIHFAAYKAVGESTEQPLKYYDNNVVGFLTLLETMIKKGVSNIVLSSSAAVYGEPPTDKVTEKTNCQPQSPYGWSKFMDEVLLGDTCAANPKLKGVALRYFNVVGAHDSALIGELPKGTPQNLLPSIVQVAAGKIPSLTIYGNDYDTPDGTCLRDYIHVVDLAKAHVAALKKLKPGYKVYNIGTGKPTSVMEMVRSFEEVNDIKVPFKVSKRRPGDPTAYYAITDKAEKDLSWKAEKTIEDAVRSSWQWQQKL